MKKFKKSGKKSNAGWYFLGITIFFFIMISIFRQDIFVPALLFFAGMVKRIILVLILVFVIMVLFNFFLTPKKLAKYFGRESGLKGWIIAVITGIISTGPIFAWYPLLERLKKRGMRTGLIATFLYNRSVKPALIPLMIFYFGLMFTIVLTFVVIGISILQGVLVEKIVGEN